MSRYFFRELHLMACLGIVLYFFCEVIFRGFTHFTMPLTGGLCAVLIHLENKKLKGKKLPFKCLLGGLTITAVEYAVGTLVNRVLLWNVWDYSDRFLNIQGQICPLFSLIWFILCIPAFFLSGTVSKFSSCFSPVFGKTNNCYKELSE